MGQQTLAGNRQEEISDTFEGLVGRAYKANGIVFACLNARMRLFSEARFQFRRYVNGRPGDYFGSPALLPLEKPSPNVTTGDLLSRMEQDVSLAGNAYIAKGAPAPGTDWPTLRRLRPDWVTIVGGSRRRPRSDNPLWESDVEVIGYVYHPGGYGGGDVELFMRDGQGELAVAHWAPTPDPDARFRGMSWLTPIVREVMADQAFTQHKLMYIEQGATPNLVVSLSDQLKPSEFASWIEAFDEQHEGLMNAYKTIYLGGGADVSVVGNNLQQLDFRNVQGAGELRIAAAAGIPAAVAGIQEGVNPTYSNYGEAKAAFADMTMRPLWRNAANSLQSLIAVPGGADLWYDDRDIPFLRDSIKERQDVVASQATTITTLIMQGFTAESAVMAVVNGDMTMLVHTGLVSVQLHDPSQPPAPATLNPGSTNGQGTPNGVPAPPA